MKKINIIFIFIALITVAISACKKDPEPGGTAVQDMAGDWHVKVNEAGAYSTLYTFNTSENTPNVMWVQAAGLKSGATVLAIKGKTGVDYPNKLFSGANIANVSTTAGKPASFSIANGKIIPNGTKGPVSKSPTDSIYFELNVSGTVYKVSGYHKTGFLEDLP
ncbi:lipid-binding protein [Pedobacter sp. R-06]|uniref:lipid-binding protein n=1 Tax=Pedobacter sp. R-06 TaxID=3404051 RepID=UPI003CF6D823